MSSKIDRRRADTWTAAMAVTLAAATVLRFIGLESGLWYDEIVTLVESARLPVYRILTEFPGANAHPLYSLFSHAALVTFGESAWALRLTACLFGVASVAMVFVLGARLTSRPEAWAGAALLATSYHHIWFSQNARGYTLIGFLALAATYCLLRAGENGRPRDYALYALTCAAGVYTHLTMAFLVAGHVVVVLLGRAVGWPPARRQPVRPLLVAWTSAGLLSAVAYAPFVGGLLATMNESRPAAQVATASWAIGEAIRQLLSGTGVPTALATGVFAAVGALSFWRRQPFAFALLVAPGAVTGAAIVALGQPLRPRFFFFLAGAAVIFAGRGLGAVVEAFERRRAIPRLAVTPAIVIVAALLIASSLISLPRNYRLPKQDFESALQFLDAADARGIRIAAAGPACFPLEAYYGRLTWPCLETLDDWRDVTADASPVLIVHTLTDYVEDPPLRDRLRTHCPDRERFPGTLGGGDLVVCEPR